MPLPENVGQNAGEQAVLHSDEIVEIAAELAGGARERPDAEWRVLGQRAGQETALRFLGDGELLLDAALLGERDYHFQLLHDVPGLAGKPPEKFFVEAGQRMHVLVAVEIQDAHDAGRFGLV